MKYFICASDGYMLSRLELSCHPDVAATYNIQFSPVECIFFSEREEAEATVQFIGDVLDWELAEELVVLPA